MVRVSVIGGSTDAAVPIACNRCLMGVRAVRMVAVVATSFVFGLSISAQSALGACGWWRPMPTPYVKNGSLSDASASSRTDAWAVGWRRTPWGWRPLTEHWDGHAWTRVPSLHPGTYTVLATVVAIAPNDVWAAGDSGRTVGAAAVGLRPLLEHWDGLRWRKVAVPYRARRAHLHDLAATSSNDVWAVGTGRNGWSTRTLHYDGKTWRFVPSVDTRFFHNDLTSVSASSPNDVWSVGAWDDEDQTGSFVEHWDGHAWSLIPTPKSVDRMSAELRSVVAISPTDAWAVGQLSKRLGGWATKTLAEHWDGRTWSVTPLPSAPPGTLTWLNGIAASGDDDVWAVGGEYDGESNRIATAHWNGTSWTQSTLKARSEELWPPAVAYVPGTAGDFWAVGNSGRHPTIFFHC